MQRAIENNAKGEQYVLFPFIKMDAFVHIAALPCKMRQRGCAALQKVTKYKKILASGDKCDYNMDKPNRF